MAARRFSFLTGPPLAVSRGGLKLLTIIFISTSKTKILSKSKLKLSSDSEDGDVGLKKTHALKKQLGIC